MSKRTPQGRRKRAENLRARIAIPEGRFPTCTHIGCGRPTVGVAIALCRKHLQRRARHGSSHCPSPSATVLKPYRAAAAAIIKARRSSPYVADAIEGLRQLLETSGPIIRATNLKGLSAKDRARAALSKLRERGVKPERLLAIVVAVHALIQHNPAVVHRIKSWRLTAIAKAAKRLASGDHQVWKMHDDAGRLVHLTEKHTYPPSSGRFLVCLGETLEEPCGWVLEHHMAEVLARLARMGTTTAAAPPQ